MPNLLTNKPIDSWEELRGWYKIFFDDTRELNWHRNPGIYRRLRLLIAQYQVFKSQVDKFTTIQQITDWLRDYTHQAIMVPMNFVDKRREPRHPQAACFDKMLRCDINITFRYSDYIEEETVEGRGVSGIMIVTPFAGVKFDTKAWQYGLASYGIYLTDPEWTTIDFKNVWRFEVSILDRDYKLTDVETGPWAHYLSKIDTEDEHEEISDWEHANRVADAIESGLYDDEIFGDGYAG